MFGMSPARADVPDLQGNVVGMSGLPGPVQDAAKREAARTGSTIGPLRSADGLYRAAMQKDGRVEVVTFDRTGAVHARREHDKNELLP